MKHSKFDKLYNEIIFETKTTNNCPYIIDEGILDIFKSSFWRDLSLGAITGRFSYCINCCCTRSSSMCYI